MKLGLTYYVYVLGHKIFEVIRIFNLSNYFEPGTQWLTPVILATEEVENRRIVL
jgi:hypothetical protein